MTNHTVDPNKKVEQAREFALEQAGWTYEHENRHPFIKLWQPPDKSRAPQTSMPVITRQLIRELLEEEKDGKRVRGPAKFVLFLAEELGVDCIATHSQFERDEMLIFATTDQLTLAFHEAFGGE